MSETPVVAQSPISFNVGGTHLMIPLSALYFNDQGQLKADRWPLYGANTSAVDALLGRLRKQGVVRAGTKPATKPSFLATAVTAGTVVRIEIEITNSVQDAATPANSKADFKTTESETYTGLQPAKLKELIGIAAGGGKSPGLVFVSSGGAPALPKAGGYPLTGDPAVVDIPKHAGAGVAFSLQSRAGGPDAALTSVEIKDVDVPGDKFTLTAKWTKTAAALAVSSLAGTIAYSATVTAPADGYKAPVEGTISLSGGADAVAVDAVKSSVIVPAK
jgi:hypothetical protein